MRRGTIGCGAGRPSAWGRALLFGLLLATAGGCDQVQELFGKEASPQEVAEQAMARARAAEKQGNFAAAEQAYREAMTALPQASAPVLALADLFERRGEDTRAIFELQQAAQIMAEDPAPYDRIGEILLRQDRYAQAAEAFGKALERDPSDPSHGRNLVLALALAGRSEQARQELVALLSGHPGEASLVALDAIVLHAEGRGTEGRARVEAAVRESTEADPFRFLGIYYLRIGEPSAAVQAFKGAVERGVHDPWTRRLMAQAMLRSGDAQGAASELQALIRERPRDAIALAVYARALLATGAYDAAQRMAQRALQQNSQLGEAYLALGEIFEAKHQPERALQAYQRALKADPRNTAALRHLALAEKGAGRLTDAAAAYERLLTIDPKDGRAKRELLEIYVHLPSDARHGLPIVNELLEENPGDLELLELKRKLKAAIKRAPRRVRRGPVIMR